MKLSELKKKFGGADIIFDTNDIKKIDPDFYYSRLTEWQKRGEIKKVTRGHYIMSDRDLDEGDLYTVANEIYYPSYISLESALWHYNVIPEGVFTITSVSTRKTKKISTFLGDFSYQKIKEPLYLGYKIIGEGGDKARIATLEKALVDYLYLHSEIDSLESIEGLRWNKGSLKNIDRDEIKRFVSLAGNRQLEKRVNLLFEYV